MKTIQLSRLEEIKPGSVLIWEPNTEYHWKEQPMFVLEVEKETKSKILIHYIDPENCELYVMPFFKSCLKLYRML